jgi:hypothetical protein
MEIGKLPSWSSICSSSTRLDVQLGAVTQATSEVAHGSHVLEIFTLEKIWYTQKLWPFFTSKLMINQRMERGKYFRQTHIATGNP